MDKTSWTVIVFDFETTTLQSKRLVLFFTPPQKCRIKLSLREKWPNCRLKLNRSVFGFQEAVSCGSGSYRDLDPAVDLWLGFSSSMDLDRVPAIYIRIRPYYSCKTNLDYIMVLILDGISEHIAQIWRKIGLFWRIQLKRMP